MVKLPEYGKVICDVLVEHTKIPYSYGDIQQETVFDKEQNRYLVMILGREPTPELSPTATRRVHGCLIHVDIIGERVFIQRDGTEEGIVKELMAAGIPEDKIVLAYKSKRLRRDLGLAI